MKSTAMKVMAGAIGILLMLGASLAYATANLLEKNGELKQQNTQLEQAVEDWEKSYKRLKKVNIIANEALSAAARDKQRLNSNLMQLRYDTQRLKDENDQIRKWAMGIVPEPLVIGLLRAGEDSEAGPDPAASESPGGDAGAVPDIENERLYGYAGELKIALKSCNADKAQLRRWQSRVKEQYQDG